MTALRTLILALIAMLGFTTLPASAQWNEKPCACLDQSCSNCQPAKAAPAQGVPANAAPIQQDDKEDCLRLEDERPRKAGLPNLAGTWKSSHHNGAAITFERGLNGYFAPRQLTAGTSTTLEIRGNTLICKWSGVFNGQATATSITANRIVWSNGNVFTR